MANYMVLINEKKEKLSILAICLLLLSVSGILLVPHLMAQWSHDRPVGNLHIVLGGLTGIMGMAGLILLLRNSFIKRNRNWKRVFISVFLTYLILQFVSATLLGGLGLLLKNGVGISYDTTKQILYVVTELFQNLIRVIVLFFLIENLQQRDWKKDKSILFQASVCALLLSIINILLSICVTGIVGAALQMVWGIIYILVFVVFFMRKKGGNE